MLNARRCSAERGGSLPFDVTQTPHINGLQQSRRKTRRPDRNSCSNALPQLICLAKRFTRATEFAPREIKFAELKFQHRPAPFYHRDYFRAFGGRQIVRTLDFFKHAQFPKMHVHFITRETVFATSITQENARLVP